MIVSSRAIGCTAAGMIALAGAVAPLAAHAPQAMSDIALSGGLLTTLESGPSAYEQLAATLTIEERKLVGEGRTFYETKWAFYWFEQGLWGRGPTSNANACAACHRSNGRGAPREGGPAGDMFVVQISTPGEGPNGGPKPHVNYGLQLQTQGVPRLIEPEARVRFAWRTRTEQFPDGEIAELRWPVVQIDRLAYGPLEESVLMSARVAPPVVGMGLLDAVPAATLLALAAREPVEGIRGRVNFVWDMQAKRQSVGRFGLKANHPTLRQQIAAAFIEDLGLSTNLFPEQNCPGAQDKCREMLVAGRPEITDYRLGAVEAFLRHTAVPARRSLDDPLVQRGESLFHDAKCAACHLPELTTGEVTGQPALSNQTIRPYTDLLLHDMGEALADGRPEFSASGRDWRTPPLWGIGLTATVNGNVNYLHDGRARTLTEAILWHDGEGAGSREAFRAMVRADRAALLAFLDSL